MVSMTTPSKFLIPLSIGLIVLLFTTKFSNFFTIETLSDDQENSVLQQNFKPLLKRLNWRYAFIGFKNIEDPYSISPLLLPDSPKTPKNRAISPDASKCFPADIPPNAITPNNCCPPMQSTFKFKEFKFEDYTSSDTSLRVRKPCHLVDEEFIAKFEKGIALMKALPKDDPRSFYQQSKIHCAYCNGAYKQQYPFENLNIDIHNSWFFFPFHRWYLYFFERILGNLIGDPNFAMPFWSWDTIDGMQIPSYFTYLNSSLYHKLRHKNHMPPHIVDLHFFGQEKFVSSQKQVSLNMATMYKQMVLASTKEIFMGGPLRHGDKPHPGIGSVELVPHNTVHTWVGADNTPNREDMGVFYTAARDPIFYPHHSNSDRLWVLWKKLGQGRRDYSDDEDWLDSSFFFYDENATLVRVKVRDCLDIKKLGYVYQDVDLPWLNFQPTPTRISKEQREGKRAQVLSSKDRKHFPLVLDSIKSVIVKRPRKLRSKLEKENEEEVLVIERIDFGSDQHIKFDVHVNDDEDELSDPDQTEFVGSFVSLHYGHDKSRRISTRFKVGMSKVLENLEADGDDDVVVTLVPKAGIGEVIIGNIRIEFVPKY